MFREAVAALDRLPRTHQEPATRFDATGRSGSAAPRWHELPIVRGGAVMIVVLALLAVAGHRLWRSDRLQGVARNAALAVPAGSRPEAMAAAGELILVLADTLAVRHRRLQDWVAAQHLERRFRGASLKNPNSLRAAAATAARLGAEAESLLVGHRLLGAILLARADSLEASGTGPDGLASSAQAMLEVWERDVDKYVELQRSAAAVVDSMAAFMLSRQASFGLRDGDPVFLDRGDGFRYRDLLTRVGELARAERTWAGRVGLRVPAWMARIPVESRPAFGRPIVMEPPAAR